MTPNSKPPSPVARVDATYAPAPALKLETMAEAGYSWQGEGKPPREIETKHQPHLNPCPSCKADFGRSWGCVRCGSWYRRDAR